MGTPEFALASLRQIVYAGYQVAGVVTAPDKPAGRGRKIQESEVKKFALGKFPILQPLNLKDPGFISSLRQWNADLFVVVAFRMLPEVVWSIPPRGTINLHASLLPQYRGAAPINRVIMNGEEETGVTTFFIEKDIDTGKILLNEKIHISHSIDAGTLHDELKEKGATLLIKSLDLIFSGKAKPLQQSMAGTWLTAPKIHPADCEVPWEKGLLQIYNHIRGLSPFPGAWTYIQTAHSEKQRIKIFKTSIIDKSHNYPLGTFLTDRKSYIHVAVKGGFLSILELQISGKSRMNIRKFLAGHHVENWKINIDGVVNK